LGFSNIFAEIRLHIYRYLLLPSVEIFLADGRAGLKSKPPKGLDTDENYPLSLDEDARYFITLLEEHSKNRLSGQDLADFEAMRRRLSRWAFTGTQEREHEMPLRHLEIFRVNRQIHNEAQAQFYSEAVLVIEPEDILCLRDILVPSVPSVWTHNPLNGTKLNGKLDPSTFAKFQRVEFDLYLVEHYIASRLFIDDETWVVNSKDAKRYQKNLTRSPLIKDFCLLISLLPRIKQLWILVRVDVEGNSNRLQEIGFERDQAEADLTTTDELLAELDMEEDIILGKINERGTPLFLHSQILLPLTTLINVQQFDFDFDEDENGEGQYKKCYEPSPYEIQKLQELQTHIEMSYKDPENDIIVS